MREELGFLMFIVGGVVAAWGILALLGWLNAGELWRLLNAVSLPGGIVISCVGWNLAYKE